jgi:hypothetical protein
MSKRRVDVIAEVSLALPDDVILVIVDYSYASK